MKKRLSTGLTRLLAAVLCVCLVGGTLPAPASATDVNLSGIKVSPWAVEEVAKALELELTDDYLAGGVKDFTVSITRKGLTELAIRYVALQNHCDYDCYVDLMLRHHIEKDEYGYAVNPFSDTENSGVDVRTRFALCHMLGIITGYEDGTFRPDQTITRQETAAIIVRAYQACGGTLPEEAAEITFTDGDDIPDWAREDASALAVWNVMKGDRNGNFNPKGLCTYEQAIAMFLRLYESAPISIAKGTVEPMFTYEQCMEECLSHKDPVFSFIVGVAHTQIAEGSRGVVVRENWGGHMHPSTKLYCVYRDGGIHQIGDTWYSGYGAPVNTYSTIESAQFSEDGKTLTCIVTTPSDYAVDGTVLTKDYYQLTADIDTRKCEVVPINPAQ